MKTSLELVVDAVESLSPTLRRLTLRSAAGTALPVAPPGAHLSLTLRAGARMWRNSYSIVTAADAGDAYQVIVRRTPDSRGGSAHIHDVLGKGDVLEASAPNSQFGLVSKARKHLLIGGGIGITPMLSFLHALRATGALHELHQFARAEEVAVFDALLGPDRPVPLVVHSSPPVDILPAVLAAQPLGTHLYMCGPAGMTAFVGELAGRLGWPGANLHVEDFGSFGGAPFTVRLARSGRDVPVGPEETMLEALEKAEVAIPSLCRAGACGRCLTGVLGGVPDHRDHYLDDEQRASGTVVMPCISRSSTPVLTLDA